MSFFMADKALEIEGEGINPLKKYYEELDQCHAFVGLFINRFSLLEMMLRRILQQLLKIDDDVWRIVFPQPPQLSKVTEAVLSLLKRDSINETTRGGVRVALEQLKDIAVLRNNVVHNGGYPSESTGKIIVRRDWFSLSDETGGEYDFYTKEDFQSALKDLELITNILMFELEEFTKSFFDGQIPDGAVKQGPWLYKPRKPKK